MVLAALLMTAAPAADVLCLNDGRVFDGLELKRVEGGVEIAFENGAVHVPNELVLDALIEGASTFVPRTPEEKEKFAEGFVPFEGRWMSVKRRDGLVARRLEERRAAIEDMRTHSTWANRHEVETKNFQFHFTIPEHLCAGLRERMEAYYEVFTKEWKVRRDKREIKLPVNIYSDRREFNRTAVAGSGGGMLAYFEFKGDYDLNLFYDRLDPVLTEMILYHETNHYLQKLLNRDFLMPHFPGESLAEYYGASRWDPEKRMFEVGLLQEGRLAEIREDILGGQHMPIRKLILEEGYAHYTWGWSLIHFLMSDERYRAKCKRFFETLANGKDVRREVGGLNLKSVEMEEVLRVFMDELGVDDDELLELESAWHAYVEGLFDQLSPAGKAKAADNAARHRLEIKAERLYREAIDEGASSAHTYHGFAGLLMGKGKRDEAAEMWREAIARDPLTAEYYASLAFALKASDEKESERLMKLAQELDPEVETEWFSFLRTD